MDRADQGETTLRVTSAEREQSRMNGMIGLAAFAVLAALWVAFGVALVVSQGSLDAVWAWLLGLPMALQVAVGLLLLPVVVGLWVWESGWPLALRLPLVAGLAIATLYVFFPRALLGGRV